MAGRVKQRKIKEKIYSWWMVIILAIIAFFFISNTWDVYKKYSASRENIAGLEENYKETQNREQELRDKISSLHSERGLEEEIREKFNVAKEGEGVVVIVDGEVSEVPQEPEEVSLLGGLWKDVLDIFR